MGAAEADDAKAATTTRIIAKENKGVICVTNKYEGYYSSICNANRLSRQTLRGNLVRRS